MFAKIKIILAAGAAVIMAILYTLLQKEKAERADEHEKIAETNRETISKNADAIIEGQKREQEIRNAEIDTDPDRDIFG
jgi:hypothetical protein